MPVGKILTITALLSALLGSVVFAQSSSPSWRLPQSTIDGGGGVSLSPVGTTYRMAGSFAQESAIGVSSSFSYILQSGFWSFQGTGLVPVVLVASKNAADGEDVDLSWSGNNPPYGVYATAGCTDVSTGFLAATPSSGFTDTSSARSTLDCYTVFATAPGPVAPAGRVPKAGVGAEAPAR